MSANKPWKKSESLSTPPTTRRAWAERHDDRCGKTFFDHRGHVYLVYRCRCGSRFFVHESHHGVGLDAQGVAVESGERRMTTYQ